MGASERSTFLSLNTNAIAYEWSWIIHSLLLCNTGFLNSILSCIYDLTGLTLLNALHCYLFYYIHIGGQTTLKTMEYNINFAHNLIWLITGIRMKYIYAIT